MKDEKTLEVGLGAPTAVGGVFAGAGGAGCKNTGDDDLVGLVEPAVGGDFTGVVPCCGCENMEDDGIPNLKVGVSGAFVGTGAVGSTLNDGGIWPNGNFGDAGLGLTTGGPCETAGACLVGSDITGAFARGELRIGRDAGRPRPRTGEGEGDEEDEPDAVGDVFGANTELVGGEVSLSGEPGGVILSRVVLV